MEFSPSLGIEVEEAMKIGSYIGNGIGDKVIEIGFTPKAIWIYAEDVITDADHAVAITDHFASTILGGKFEVKIEQFQGIVEGGFKVGQTPDGSGLNQTGKTYFWMAV